MVISRQTAFAGTFLGILYGGLIMPVIEEIFFRGVIFHTARQKRGNLYAVLISSFLFAIGHLNGVQFISGIFMVPIWLGILLLVFGILMLRREARKVT